MKKSQKALSTKFVEVPLPKFEVEDIAGATMTTDSEAGQAYQQFGKIFIIKFFLMFPSHVSKLARNRISNFNAGNINIF